MDRKKEDWSEPPRGEEDVGERHPSDAELLGESEYSRRLAGGDAREQAIGQGRAPRRAELAADPEDLGRRALEDATQNLPLITDPAEEAEEPPRSRHRSRPGERRMREADSDKNDDRLISRMDNRSETEARISREARRAQEKLDKET